MCDSCIITKYGCACHKVGEFLLQICAAVKMLDNC